MLSLEVYFAGRRDHGRYVKAIALVLVLVLTGPALAGILACGVGRGAGDAHRVYAVAQVQAGLVRDPKVWVNRTVLVRGRIMQGYWMSGRVRFTWGLADYCAATPSGCPSDSPPGLLIPRGTVVHLGLRSDVHDSENRYRPILTRLPVHGCGSFVVSPWWLA